MEIAGVVFAPAIFFYLHKYIRKFCEIPIDFLRDLLNLLLKLAVFPGELLK